MKIGTAPCEAAPSRRTINVELTDQYAKCKAIRCHGATIRVILRTVDISERLFYKGADDIPFRLITGLNLSAYSASDLTITVQKPSGSQFTVTEDRSIVDAAEGVIQANFLWENFDETGEYFIQVKAALGGQPTIQSQICSFFVDDDVVRAQDDRYAWTPDSIGDYATATAAEKALYGYFTDPSGLNADGTSGAEFS